MFLAQSESMAPPQEPADADAPVMCETICRPINETEQLLAGAAGVYAKHAGNPEPNAEAKAVKETVEGASPEATMLLQLSRKVCTMHGGKYVDESGECEPFMRGTQAAVQYGERRARSGSRPAAGASKQHAHPRLARPRGVLPDGEAIFAACQAEHGSSYVPCNPYQALALAHLVSAAAGEHSDPRERALTCAPLPPFACTAV